MALSSFGARRDLRVDGQRLAVFELGEGEPCLLLHGYPQTHWCWNRVAPGLAIDHRVIAPDWFGWGESERSLQHPPIYEAEVERLRQLLDALGLSRVNLFCHDYGGFIGMGFTQKYPACVQRLAIINSRCQGTFAPMGFLLFNLFVLAARSPIGNFLYASFPLADLHRSFMRRYVRNGSFTDEELEGYVGFLRRREGRLWLAYFYRYFQATRRRQLRDGCRSLKMPAAVIWGDQDTYSPVSIGLELGSLLPSAEFTRVAGADHYVMEERPKEVVEALQQLLGRAS